MAHPSFHFAENIGRKKAASFLKFVSCVRDAAFFFSLFFLNTTGTFVFSVFRKSGERGL